MHALATLWTQGDAVARGVLLVLLAMSCLTWVLVLWKGLLLRGARRSVALVVPAYWQAPSAAEGARRAAALDGDQWVTPLLAARQAASAGTLAAEASLEAHATRHLRGALQAAGQRLHGGQVALASIGATAPFVGLLGTVWGVYLALATLADSEGAALGMAQVAGPVGDALVMTAAGLVVAIPAVLAYNAYGRLAAQLEADLDGFAHDLLALGCPKATA